VKVKVGDLVKCDCYYGDMIGLVTKIEPYEERNNRLGKRNIMTKKFSTVTVQGEWEVQCYDVEVEVVSASR